MKFCYHTRNPLTTAALLLCISCSDFTTEGLLGGDFVNPRPLSITSAIGTDSNQLKIRFGQNLMNTESVTAEQFVIQRTDTESPLSVAGFIFDEATPSELILVTGFQFTDVVYNLRLFGLEGEGGYSTPASGIETQFTGFNPNTFTRNFRIITPATAVDNEPFEITVDALNSSDASFYVNMAADIDITTTGSGGLTIEDAPGWVAGSQTITLRYDGGLAALTTEDIVISIKAVNNSAFNGLSSNITITSAVELNRFFVNAPASASVNEQFSVTITAVGDDGLTYEAYDGTVSLAVIDAYSGNLDKITVTGFVDGVLTTNLTFSGFADAMKIRATDTDDTTSQGESDEIVVGMGTGNNFSLNLVGVPLTGDKVRLSWQEVVGAFLYKVYRRPFGTGSFSEIASLSATARNHLDTGLTDGQEYEYKVSAIDSGTTVMAEATLAVTSVTNCGVTINGSNNSITTGIIWEKANSPYCIESNVAVSGSLLIQAGVIMLFDNGRGITVNSGGSLAAFGTNTDKIIFTSINDDPNPGNWDRIDYQDGATPTTFDVSNNYVSGSGLRNIIVEYGTRAIRAHVSLSIEEVLFRYNDTGGDGGAIYLDLVSEKIVIRNSNMSNNSGGGDGGSIHVLGTGEMEISSSVFENNDAGLYGGALAVPDLNLIDVTITGSFFRKNSSQHGGALFFEEGSHTVSDSIFIENSASSTAGAIYSDVLQLTVSDSVFLSNDAGIDGGALYHFGGQLDLTGSNIEDNSAANRGGGIYLRGIFNSTNNVFRNNFAITEGGALYQTNSQMTIINKTSFLGNTTDGRGGALSFDTPRDRVITNSLLQNNNAATNGGAIRIGNGNGSDLLNFTHNSIYDNSAGGTGNNVQNEDDNTQVAGENYFGNDTTDKTTMGICDGTASSGTCGLGIVDTNDPSGAVATPWPLCSADSSDPDCVGADF